MHESASNESAKCGVCEIHIILNSIDALFGMYFVYVLCIINTSIKCSILSKYIFAKQTKRNKKVKPTVQLSEIFRYIKTGTKQMQRIT